MATSLSGKLVVATPKLLDPNFHRAVVLICRHDENGAFGLILNRPLGDAPVAAHLPSWAEFAAHPAVMFLGGPVEPTMAFGLAGGDADHGLAQVPVIDGLSQVDLAGPPPSAWATNRTIRVFVGYAGWGAGQLDGEVDAGAWFVVDAAPSDALTPEPEMLWQAVLRRQPGRLAMFAFAPADPSAN